MKPFIKGTFLLLIFATIVSCATVPLTGRRQLSLVNEAEIQQQAALAYRDFLGDSKTKIIKGTSQAQQVQRVGQNIAAAVTRFLQENGYGNQYNFEWEFNLIQEDQINAWCMPGGKVAIYTGILPVTKNEAGLATVMGHEIAHAIAKHSAERMSQTIIAQAGGVAVDVATAERSNTTRAVLNTAYGLGGQLALLSYSRNQESEADRLGLVFMAMAGYNPNEAVGFWERMAQAKQTQGGGAPPEFLSTHPSDARRINNIQRLIPEAMAYYKK
ncbi:M48 family metallopeptidase [Parapedobacter sp. ISTM3]|uniref:Peptidase family M48 n=1 Tax=Parapedobacter luteus TaxID=623280 RepID=A0A1T5ARB3_9SPHI|nr:MULTISPECIES: M48 family metallopeptidase [Parapedobacter]MBK1441992.1 M48 family metallopeptidase [Parapedobacter sp. ISTM3]SKB37564.1 Peptidase family M48 [Parapedobacter luteus]